MGLVATIARRGLLQRPGRTLFSVLGIALGIATAVGVFTLDHNTVLGLSLKGAQEWQPGLEVRPAQDVDDPQAELAATPGVAGVTALFQNDVNVTLPDPVGGEEPAGRDRRGGARARLFALEARSLASVDTLRVQLGEPLAPEAAEREALVGEGLAEDLGLAVGDTILLARPQRAPRQACEDGVLVVQDSGRGALPARREAFRVTGILAREKLGRRSQGRVVVVDYAWGRELFEGAHVAPVYWLERDPAVDVERLRASLGASFSYELNKTVLVGAAADERAFRNGVRMAGLFALVLGLYVIFHTLSMSLVERVREVATLSALGATRGQILRTFLAEAAAIAAAALALGIAGGLALARGLLVLGVTTLGTGHRIEGFDVPWATVLALGLLGVGVALLGSVYPLLRARRTSPAAALRGEAALAKSGVSHGFHLFAAILLVGLLPGLYFVIVPVVGEAQGVLVGAVLGAVGLLALLVVLPLVVPAAFNRMSELLAAPLERIAPLSGALAARGMRESRTRVSVSAAAIALVAAAFVGLKGMTRSLSGEIEEWAAVAIADKVYLGKLPNVAFDDLKRTLEKYPGVVALESGGARTYVPFLLIGTRVDELRRFGPCRAEPAIADALAAGEGLIASDRLAKHLGYAVGDVVHVGLANGTVRDLRVLAISDAYGYFPHPDERIYGVVSDEFLRRGFCVDVAVSTDYAVKLEEGGDHGVVLAAVDELLPDRRGTLYETGAGLLQAHLDDIGRDFKLFDLILGLTAALAGLGVLNGQLLAALERAKELGVLKALGTVRAQIAGMVVCEALVIGVIGGLLGTALGAALTPVIVTALEGLSGLRLPHVGPGPWVWIVPAGAVVLALAASLYPIARMNRMSAVAAVRTG